MTLRSLAYLLVPAISLLPFGCGESSDSDPGSDAEAGQAGVAAGGNGIAGTAGAAGSGGAGAGEDGGAGADAAGGEDGAGGDEGGLPDPGPPLLDRPPEITYDCEIARPMQLLGLNPWSNGGLFASGGVAYLPRIEGDSFSGGGSVTWSTLDVSGVLGTRHVLATAAGMDGSRSQLTGAASGDRFSLLWVEGFLNDTQLVMGEVKAEGEVLMPPTPLLGGGVEGGAPRIVALADG